MKKIFAKQHNLFAIAACIIFAQFISAIIFAYLQVIGGLSNLINMSFYIYMAYCIIVCVFCVLFIIKKTSFIQVKLWFAGLFLYIFCEILFFAKLFITAYRDIPGFSLWESNFERTVSTYNLQDGQPFFRIFLAFAFIFMLYACLYIFEKKRAYLNLALFNIIIFSFIIIIMPAASDIASEHALDILAFTATREAALPVIFVNLIIHAFYSWYKQ